MKIVTEAWTEMISDEDMRPGSAFRLNLLLTNQVEYLDLLDDDDMAALLNRLGGLRGLRPEDLDAEDTQADRNRAPGDDR